MFRGTIPIVNRAAVRVWWHGVGHRVHVPRHPVSVTILLVLRGHRHVSLRVLIRGRRHIGVPVRDVGNSRVCLGGRMRGSLLRNARHVSWGGRERPAARACRLPVLEERVETGCLKGYLGLVVRVIVWTLE